MRASLGAIPDIAVALPSGDEWSNCSPGVEGLFAYNTNRFCNKKSRELRVHNSIFNYI